MIFPEALNTIEQYREFSDSLSVPILANITEFGQTPLFSKSELSEVGVDMILYPLSAFRAMSNAALNVYQHILNDGHQHNVLDSMQTRDELYDFLDYHRYEKQLDDLFKKESKK
jgi:methylisocitrate lyase